MGVTYLSRTKSDMEVGLEGCLDMLLCACCLFICTLKKTHTHTHMDVMDINVRILMFYIICYYKVLKVLSAGRENF